MTQASATDIIIGVDTHKHTHAAVAITGLGARVAELTIKVGRHGYRQLETWAASLGTIHAFGIEGTGSYGAGLARALRDGGHTVHEVSRPDRRLRRQHGKTDHLDAEGAARAVLGGQATGLPKASTGRVEMIRDLKIARDTAVKARTQAMLTLKAVIIAVPAVLREKLEAITGTMALIRHLAALRPGAMTSPTASAKASLRALARRWLDLDAEIKAHDAHLEALVEHCAPTLVRAYGIKAGTAAEMLILVGDNPERIRSEGALAKLCGACPIPGLQRQGHPTQAQPRRQPAGQRRPSPRGRRAPARPPAYDRLRPAPHGRRKEQGGDHSLSQALRGPGNLRPFVPLTQT